MTQTDKYKGYRDAALNVMKSFKAEVWSDVEIITKKGTFKGIILPRFRNCRSESYCYKNAFGLQCWN